jgi:N-acetyl-anhydromuramyl-L-alanine amidase AmpD
MKFIDLPSPNYWQANDLKQSKIEAICLHGTDGPASASLSWLCNPKSGVSANFLVAKDGQTYKLVDPATRRAWANGKVDTYDASIKWLDTAVKNKINPNFVTWSVEHEASRDDMMFHRPMTDAQFSASIDLVAYLLRLAGLKANHETLIAHCQICALAKPYCPGVIFVPAYLQVLQQRHLDLI